MTLDPLFWIVEKTKRRRGLTQQRFGPCEGARSGANLALDTSQVSVEALLGFYDLGPIKRCRRLIGDGELSLMELQALLRTSVHTSFDATLGVLIAVLHHNHHHRYHHSLYNTTSPSTDVWRQWWW